MPARALGATTFTAAQPRTAHIPRSIPPWTRTPRTRTVPSRPARSITSDLNASSGVGGYNLYRGTTSNGAYTKINSTMDANTAYTDSTVAAGQVYYFRSECQLGRWGLQPLPRHNLERRIYQDQFHHGREHRVHGQYRRGRPGLLLQI